MIILPVEKKFDWNHAPIVLFALALVNIAVYFLYQSADESKIVRALDDYARYEYLQVEWPHFQTFLENNGELEELEDFRELYDNEQEDQLSYSLLRRNDFYLDFKGRARSEMYERDYIQWDRSRALIQSDINSVSSLAWGLKKAEFNPLTLFTHQFLHGSLMHLMGNLFFLIVFGFAVEAAIGHKRFLAFYLISGAIAGLSHLLAESQGYRPLIGASGAISGVMAMYLMVFQFRKIEFFYWVFFLVGYFRAPALTILPLYIGKEIYYYLEYPESSVAFLAHTGGFVSGALLLGFALFRNPNILNKEYVEKDQRADPFAEQLNDIYSAIAHYHFDRALGLVDRALSEDQEDFRLLLIRYNLLKLQKGEELNSSATALLHLRTASPKELSAIESIWKDNPQLHGTLGESELLDLGLRITTHGNEEIGEDIFQRVKTQNPNNTSLSIYARKLATLFAERRDHAKKIQYNKIADEMIKEGRNGFL